MARPLFLKSLCARPTASGVDGAWRAVRAASSALSTGVRSALFHHAWSIGLSLSVLVHLSVIVGVGAVFGSPAGWGILGRGESGSGEITYVSFVVGPIAPPTESVNLRDAGRTARSLLHGAGRAAAEHRPAPRVSDTLLELAPERRTAGEPSSGDAPGGGSPRGSEAVGGSSGSGGVGSSAGRRGVVAAPPPPFPREARAVGFEGRAIFRVEVAPNGAVLGVDLTQSSGREDCDAAAKNTIAERWRFDPAPSLGVTTERVAVAYRLE